jgi:hypothetical protein
MFPSYSIVWQMKTNLLENLDVVRYGKSIPGLLVRKQVGEIIESGPCYSRQTYQSQLTRHRSRYIPRLT